MSLFVCAKCGCVDNTATSSYWMLTNEYMVDEYDKKEELIIFQMKDSRNIKSSCQIPIKRNSVSRDIIM